MSATIAGMRSIFFDAPGGPEVLRLREEPRPRAAEGELLVRVLASGVNGADLNLRSGRTRAADTSGRPGLEVCGIVEQLGPGVDAARSPSGTRWSVGDAVCALVAGGGYAEYVAAPVEQCLPPPRGMDALHAAGVIETAATVWDNVFIRGGLAAGEVFLVHGGASGIGTTAIQLARERGARVFATAGSAEKAAIATSLGAERCFEYRREDFVAGLRAAAGGADVILDVAGAGYLARNLAALNMDGRLVVIAVNAGAEGMLDLRQVMQKRAVLTGSILKSRTPAQKRGLLEAVWREVWPLYADGRMKAVVGNVLPLARAAEAHAVMEAGGVVGKTILDCGA
jgi:putative PIG3 family NAD(P)H quinone oxidoreductase